MLLNGYAGYSAYLVCSTDAEGRSRKGSEYAHFFEMRQRARKGTPGLWTRRMDRTRCLVVKESGIGFHTVFGPFHAL